MRLAFFDEIEIRPLTPKRKFSARGRALGAESGELQGMTDAVKAELAGFFLKGGDQALVEADGRVAFTADDMVVVVGRFLGKVEFFSADDNSLE